MIKVKREKVINSIIISQKKKGYEFMKAKLEKEFWHWMNENWNIAGGLIQQAIAARLMGKTKTRVRQMINEGKLKEYKFKTTTFVSFADVMKYTREEAYESLEKATEILFGDASEIMTKIIKQQKNMVTGKSNTEQTVKKK